MSQPTPIDIDGLIYLDHALYGIRGYGKRATARVISQEGWPPSTIEWVIMSIRVQPSRRGQGLGGRLLRAICTAADERTITLRLYVDALHPIGLDADLLGAWYQRHGFEYIEPSAPFEMIRHPKGQP